MNIFFNFLNNHQRKNRMVHYFCLPIRIFSKSIGVRHESRSSRILHLCNCPSWFRAHRRRRGIFHLFPFYLVYHPSWDPSWRLPIRLYYLCYLCYFCCLCYLRYFCCCGRDHVCLVCYLS